MLEEEEAGLLEKAFVVDEVTRFCGGTPTNGHEYLLSVRNEARKCPSVISAKVNRNKFKQQTYYVSENKPKVTDVSLLPSSEWQRWQCEEFDRVREDLAKRRRSLNFQIKNKLKIPEEVADEKEWFKFCFNSEHSEDKYPLLTHVLVLKQTTLTVLLGLFSSWIKESRIHFSNCTCLWLYSLMSCLEIPLLPETCFNLRRIATDAVETRSKMIETNEELLIRLNLIICIVGKYFRQTDLADN